MSMKRSPEWYELEMRRQARWKAEERARKAREWNGHKDTDKLGNVEFVTVTGGGPCATGHTERLDGAAGGSPKGLTLQQASPAADARPAGRSGPLTKFRNVKTDGYASKKEAKRASDLRLLQEAGRIRNLREQLQYELIPRQEGERACFYRADFVYEEFGADGWRQVVEDTKGVRTADYVIKRKLMLHVHGIRIRET